LWRYKLNEVCDREFLLTGDLLVVLKRKFEGGDNELAKVVELK